MSDTEHGRDQLDPRRLAGKNLQSITPELISARIIELEQELAQEREVLRGIISEEEIVTEIVSDMEQELGALRIVSNLFGDETVPKRGKRSRRTREERIAVECLEEASSLDEACEEAHILAWENQIAELREQVDKLQHCITRCRGQNQRKRSRRSKLIGFVIPATLWRSK